MYGKFFASAFTGSMVGAGTDVFAVWGYVIANADVDGRVELNPAILAAVLGASVERIEAAIRALCEPDPRSRNPAEDGRRLLPAGPFEYRVTSHERYRAIRNEDDRRAYNRERQREHRARVKSAVNDSNTVKADVAHTEAEAYTEREGERTRTLVNDVIDIPAPWPATHNDPVVRELMEARDLYGTLLYRTLPFSALLATAGRLRARLQASPEAERDGLTPEVAVSEAIDHVRAWHVDTPRATPARLLGRLGEKIGWLVGDCRAGRRRRQGGERGNGAASGAGEGTDAAYEIQRMRETIAESEATTRAAPAGLQPRGASSAPTALGELVLSALPPSGLPSGGGR